MYKYYTQVYICCIYVHLYFYGSFVWSLGFRNIYSVERMYIFTFLFFNIFFFFCFFLFLDYFAIFKVSVIVCWIVQIKCLVFAQRAKDFETCFLVSSVCLVVCFFLVLLLFLYVFVLTLLVDVFSFLWFLFVYRLCFVGPSTSV